MSTTALTKATDKPPVSKPSALQMMAARLSVDPLKLMDSLKATVFQKATNEELLALTVVANEYGLNPFLKELYAFPAKGGGIVPIVSVDGWNKMLIRQPDFDGIEFSFEEIEGDLISCTAIIYVKNRSHPVKITEYLSECQRNTDPWKSMPRRMLRNRTLCQASRMAFGFSGVYNEDEAIDISAVVTSDPAATTPPKGLPASPPPPVQGTEKSPQEELEAELTVAGFSFAEFIAWAGASNQIEDPTSIGSFGELPTDVCRRMLRAKVGLLKGLQAARG